MGSLPNFIAKLNSLLGHLQNHNVDKTWVAKDRGIVFCEPIHVYQG